MENEFFSRINYKYAGIYWQLHYHFVSGGIALIWTANWFLLVKNNPRDDKFISKAERIYLMEVSQVNPGKVTCIFNVYTKF